MGGQVWVPAESGSGALGAVVVRAVVWWDVAPGEVVAVDQVFSLYPGAGLGIVAAVVDHAAAIAFLFAFPVVVGKGLGHWVHSGITANAFSF